MAHSVVWGDEAKENYRAITLYLLDDFGFDVADRFTDTIADKLLILEHSPFIGGQLASLPGVRKLLIQPYNTLYYAMVGQQVCILNILDSRRKNSL